MRHSYKDNFMMSYGPLHKVKEHLSKMDSGAHFDHEVGLAGLDRLKKDAPTEHAAHFDAFLNHAMKHGSYNNLRDMVQENDYDKHSRSTGLKHKLTTNQLTKIWHHTAPSQSHQSEMHEAILERPNVPPSLLREAMKNSRSYIREAAVKHVNAPDDLIRQGAKDEDPDVRAAAQKTAKARRVKLS